MYCVKCRAKKEGKDKKKVTLSDKKTTALVGICETCGTKMYLLGS